MKKTKKYFKQIFLVILTVSVFFKSYKVLSAKPNEGIIQVIITPTNTDCDESSLKRLDSNITNIMFPATGYALNISCRIKEQNQTILSHYNLDIYGISEYTYIDINVYNGDQVLALHIKDDINYEGPSIEDFYLTPDSENTVYTAP